MTWEQNRLMHFGIPGQKWGVRRYQNEDGTLTEEGKQRYGYGDGDGDPFDDRHSGQKADELKTIAKTGQDSDIDKMLREASDQDLAKSKEIIKQSQRNLRARSLIQGVAGLSMMALGNRVSRSGRLGIGAMMYGIGAAHVLRTGINHIGGTSVHQMAKNRITQEEKARQKRA